MKILAVKLRAIGDTVIWTSALQALRAAYPQAEIVALTYASNAPVLEGLPAIDRLHLLKTSSRWELIKTLWKLRGSRFSLLLGFHATTSLCRYAWLAGAKQLALHHHSWKFTPRGSLPIPQAGNLEDAIRRDYRVLEAVGVAPSPALPTRIFIRQEEAAAAQAKMSETIKRAGGDPGLPRFLFLPGAGHHLRRYPKELWLPLAQQMREHRVLQPVVVADQALSDAWNLPEECRSRNIPFCDGGSLREFLAALSLGQAALANDSGPGHMAVALGLRTTFVFGPGCVGDWHPYDKVQHPLFRVEVPCRAEGPRDLPAFQFCTVKECSHHRCMREIKIDLKALEGVLF